MADEKSIVKMNKMIQKKTGASFLVVYVIYVSLVYTDSKKTASCLLPRHTIFATFGRQLRLMTTRIFLFYFLRDQNSQHFNEDLLGVNASAFSFVLCFKATDYAGASSNVIGSLSKLTRRPRVGGHIQISFQLKSE